jgi:uncharacterized protein YlaI
VRVKCVLCDKIEKINSELPLAKKLRNRPIHTYMCEECSHRVTQRTEARLQTGSFRKHHKEEERDEYI